MHKNLQHYFLCLRFEEVRDAFADACQKFARGGPNVPATAPATKVAMLKYRRGNERPPAGAAVLATPYARKALDNAFGTGIDTVVATFSQVSNMDTKVRLCPS